MENEIRSDDGHAFKLLLSCPSGLSPSQVSVEFDQLDMIPYQASDLRNSISEYGGCNFSMGNDSKQEPHVCLHLSLTDYRTFVGTNLGPIWERFVVPSEDDCEQCQHISSPLGYGAVVETSDIRILVLQRSNKVGEFPGY
ncbi:nudix hydrolase 9-like isoform X2 [Nicotiana sylvestris]|uniref:nudix hydrolase 9-like isoform X2 n=1 Tax=Nicotiana sylvestris TaxID=4096 RepID=UPI00388CB9DE